MANSRSNIPISQWQAGDTITGFALLTKKEQRQDRNGKTFLDMEVADASGSMAAKAWSDSAALNGDYAPHDYVALRGTVKEFKGQLQLSVRDCRRVDEADREHGFDEALLIPSTSEDIDDLWRRLKAIYEGGIQRPEMRQLAAQALSTWGSRLRVHPAAKSIHHAYRGGLLEHVVSMAELAAMVAGHYGDMDRDQVLLGVLFHDLGKIHEIGAMPANDYTPVGQLVGHVVLGRDMLREAAAQVPDFPDDDLLRLEHLVLAHQGRHEYAAPVEPMTLEALVLHYIDDLDSKVNQMRGIRREGPGFRYVRGLGRYVLVDEEPAATDKPGEEETDESDEDSAQQRLLL